MSASYLKCEKKQMVDLESLKRFFKERFGDSPRLFSAPGRVNLIGEHTDYNDGFVLPMAVNRRTVVAASVNRDSELRVHSLTLSESAEIALDHKPDDTSPHWVSYVKGVAEILLERRLPISGANLAIASDVPIGAGMSSSAALEMSVGMALTALAGVKLDLVQLALAAQRAEHEYAGAKVGLMDQLAAAFGKRDHALLIDCRSLERTLIPLKINNTAVVVCNTNVKHQLAASEYNKRREECEEGVRLLHERLPNVRALRDVSLSDLAKYGPELPEVIRRRCRHVVTENERTLEASEALRDADVKKFGALMLKSHTSLRDDYEVSSKELDLMVELALKQNGVLGARMTGGGFGGCTVNLVQGEKVQEFCDRMLQQYKERTGIAADIYVVEAEDGVREEL